MTTDSTGLHCCYIADGGKGAPCEKPAICEIIDTLDGSPEGYTHSCGEHIGDLLGHNLDIEVGDRDEVWQVNSITDPDERYEVKRIKTAAAGDPS